MSARKKPAPLVWTPIAASVRRSSFARFGEWEATVWHHGGQFPWRSMICLAANESGTSGGRRSRIVSHFGEDSAKASAENRLRKAAT